MLQEVYITSLLYSWDEGGSKKTSCDGLANKKNIPNVELNILNLIRHGSTRQSWSRETSVRAKVRCVPLLKQRGADVREVDASRRRNPLVQWLGSGHRMPGDRNAKIILSTVRSDLILQLNFHLK